MNTPEVSGHRLKAPEAGPSSQVQELCLPRRCGSTGLAVGAVRGCEVTRLPVEYSPEGYVAQVGQIGEQLAALRQAVQLPTRIDTIHWGRKCQNC